jgi:hypothetical protein
MKQRFLLPLFALLTTTITFAMNPSTGKMISHKEWSTGKIKVTFEEKEITKSSHLNHNFKEILTNGDYIYVHHTMPETITVNKDEKIITSNGNMWITNNTSISQTYKSHTILCIGNDDENGNYVTNSCTHSDSLFTLYPNNSFGTNVHPSILSKSIPSGSYIVAIYSEVKRDDQQTVFASNAYGKMIINN